MSTESERVMATLKGLTELAKSVTDPTAKAELEGLVEDWTIQALMLDAREKQDRTE
jgi:hypothetical protein